MNDHVIQTSQTTQKWSSINRCREVAMVSRTALLGVSLLASKPALCQNANEPVRAQAGMIGSNLPRAEFVRANILDPGLGQRWELSSDSAHPAGPWRLVLVGYGVRAKVSASGNAVSPQLLIHSGERVLVGQQTTVLEARFTAVALEPAVAGQKFRVRLSAERNSPGSASGPIIEVTATASGQACWESSEGEQP